VSGEMGARGCGAGVGAGASRCMARWVDVWSKGEVGNVDER